MKSSTVYQRGDTVFCHSLSKTEVGLWILTLPVGAAEKDDPAAVARLVEDCLSASREGVPHPTDFKNLFKPMLDLAGVKSVTAFSKPAKCVSVDQDDSGRINLTPTRNGGKSEGFIPFEDRVITAASVDDDLGAKILAALAASE